MGPLSYMRSVVDRNVVMRRMPVLALCFKWDCKHIKTESTWNFFPLEINAAGKGGGGGQGFEFMVSLTLETIKIYKYRQNTTKFIILYHFWTTCFDSLESSSGPLVN